MSSKICDCVACKLKKAWHEISCVAPKTLGELVEHQVGVDSFIRKFDEVLKQLDDAEPFTAMRVQAVQYSSFVDEIIADEIAKEALN